MNKKYILNEIKKANKYVELIYDYLSKTNNGSLNKTIYRITEINEILTNLEISLEEGKNVNE